VVKLGSNLTTNAAAMEELEQEITTLDEQLQTVVEHVAQLKEKSESAQIAVENSKDDLRKLKTELDEMEEKISEFLQIEV